MIRYTASNYHRRTPRGTHPDLARASGISRRWAPDKSVVSRPVYTPHEEDCDCVNCDATVRGRMP
jgi:hypothetical protein